MLHEYICCWVSITYSEGAFVALGTQHDCHLWPVRLYSIFPPYLINGMILEKDVTEHKMRVLISYTSFVRTIYHTKKELSEI